MKKVDQEAEKIEALGQENEKDAIKDTTKILKEEENKHDELENRKSEYLHKARQSSVSTYNRALATLLEGKLMTIDKPQGWDFIVYPTEEGIILEVNYQSPTGYRMFRTAFKPSMIEKYDLNAVNVYVIRTENTIDRVMYRDASSPIAKHTS